MSCMWATGPPEMAEPLAPLRGWTRDGLIAAMQRFRSQPNMAISLGTFWRVLDCFATVAEAERAFEIFGARRSGHVDFLSVLLPMVVVSQQKYISRVTFLFSVIDFNSSGSITRSELYIGLRALCRGLQHFFVTSSPASGGELEKASNSAFGMMDEDGSGLVSLEEILTFAYRSKALRNMMAPFPSADCGTFEELIVFHSSTQQERKEEERESSEGALTWKLRTTPDPLSAIRAPRKRHVGRPLTKPSERRWTRPPEVTRPHAFLAWAVFHSVEQDALVSLRELLELLKHGNARLLKVLEDSAKQLEDEGRLEEHRRDGAKQVLDYTYFHLCAGSTLQNLLEQGDEQISLRAYFAAVWDKASEREISRCLKWCKHFQAMAALQQLLKPTDSHMVNSKYDPIRDKANLRVSEADIDALFEVMDQDGDGRLTVKEMLQMGCITERDAKQLFQLWDGDRDGHLTKGELMSIVVGINQVVHHQLKRMFASTLQDSVRLPLIAPRPRCGTVGVVVTEAAAVLTPLPGAGSGAGKNQNGH